MTTTLTSRPLPLLPLALPASMTCNERSSSIGSGSPSSSIMHPDSIMLQNHGVTSPRLCSSASSASSSGMYGKNCDSPPISSLNDNFNRMRSSVTDSDGENYSNLNHNKVVSSGSLDENDEVTDRLSCCSDDSELSVGQECCDNNNSEQNLVEKQTNSNISLSSNSNVRNNVRSSNGLTDDCESIDNSSNVSDVDRPTPSAGDPVAVDEASNDSSPNVDVDSVMMTAAAAAAIRVPPIIRPSPTRLQEEFLRKSHLYAEELMKQQMQFMAAARASAFSTLRHGGVAPEMGKIGFRPHVKQFDPSSVNDNLVNFSGIHSHLNAISKMSSHLAGASGSAQESALSKLTAFGLSSSREPSQSPPSLSYHYPMHPNPQHPFMNNNLNDSNLKFSIDNILKADFGRRITDPLLKRASGNYPGNSGKGSSNSRKTHHRSQTDSVSGSSDKHGAPIDLTNVLPHPNNNNNNNSNHNNNNNNNAITNNSIVCLEKLQNSTQQTPVPIPPPQPPPASANSQSSQPSCATASTTSSSSSSTTSSTSSTSESSSGGPMVWPAWVYCTRYSDRPSSGPRTRKPKKPPSEKGSTSSTDEKRPRTAFSGPQLARLKHEFSENRYLTERRRQQLSGELGLNEAQIKIWFQNKRAKIKKASGTKNPLALQLMAQGLYNHSTVPLTREEEELQELQAKGGA